MAYDYWAIIGKLFQWAFLVGLFSGLPKHPHAHDE
jgi:hypothetical protein